MLRTHFQAKKNVINAVPPKYFPRSISNAPAITAGK